MRILGLDQATSCGWALYDKDVVVLGGSGPYSWGVWNLSLRGTEGEGARYIKLYNELEKLLPLDFIIYEKVARHMGTDAAHIYGGLTAVIQMFCEHNNIQCIGVPVGTWKKAAVGNGRAKKKEIMLAAKEKWGYHIKKQDSADALFILEFGLQKFSTGE